MSLSDFPLLACRLGGDPLGPISLGLIATRLGAPETSAHLLRCDIDGLRLIDAERLTSKSQDSAFDGSS